jgi:hypothetical protein
MSFHPELRFVTSLLAAMIEAVEHLASAIARASGVAAG